MFTCKLLKLKNGIQNRSILNFIDPKYRHSDNLSVHNIDKSVLNVKGRIFILNHQYSPSWLSELYTFSKSSNPKKLQNSVYSALIIFQVNTSHYAISYGKGSILLDSDRIDHDFVNLVSRQFLACNSGQVTYMDQSHIFSINPLKYEVSSLSKSNIPYNRNFVNQEPFVLTSFKTKGVVSLKNNSGNSSDVKLTLSPKLGLEVKIDTFDLKYLFSLVNYFESLTQSQPAMLFDNEILKVEDNKALFKELSRKFHSLCASYDKSQSLTLKALTNISLSDSDQNFSYLISKVSVYNKIKNQDLNSLDFWEHLISSIIKSESSDPVEFLRKSIVSKFDDDGQIISRQSLLNYINYNYQKNGNVYFLSNASWYTIESNFYFDKIMKSVSDISRIDPKKFSFDDMTTNDKSENFYTKRVFDDILKPKQKTEDWFLMDKNTINPRNPQISNHSSIELSDLLLIEKDKANFFCLKVGTSGNGFSHLINQAANSVEALKDIYFEIFLQQLNNELQQQGKPSVSADDFRKKKKHIILGLLVKKSLSEQKELTKMLPIMSILSLYHLKAFLKYENCELSIMTIVKN